MSVSLRPIPDLRRSLRLMVITDRSLAGQRRWLHVVEAALEAGATAIQLRDKQATIGELLAMAEQLASLAERYAALFLVNDRHILLRHLFQLVVYMRG